MIIIPQPLTTEEAREFLEGDSEITYNAPTDQYILRWRHWLAFYRGAIKDLYLDAHEGTLTK